MFKSVGCFKASFVLLFPVTTFAANAALVWNGPSITYAQPGIDTTVPANQDRLTPHVWLTRTNSGGLFNALSETAAGLLSPADTQWAFGTAQNYQNLTYTNWLAWLNGQSPTNLVGKDVVVHLISEDIYVSMKFTLWGSKGAGGFAYIRSTPPASSVIWNVSATNEFQFDYSSASGSNYVVEASADLLAWAPVATNSAVSTVGAFQDTATNGARFYRVRQVAP
jgi:hypothetical protein